MCGALAAGTLASCGSDNSPDVSAITEFDTSEAAGYGPHARLNLAILTDPSSAREAALAELDNDDPDVRLAALYAASRTAEPGDREAFSTSLDSADARERVLSATALVSLGETRAIPVLIDALGDDTPMPFSSPPAAVWQYARYALLQATGEDFGLLGAASLDEAAATRQEWESWWGENGSSFEIREPPDSVGP